MEWIIEEGSSKLITLWSVEERRIITTTLIFFLVLLCVYYISQISFLLPLPVYVSIGAA